MSDKAIILIVVFIGFFVVSLIPILLFRYFYSREVRIKTLSTTRVEGVVVGYRYSKPSGPPIVEYEVNGQTYQRNLEYYRVLIISAPWKSVRATSDSDLLAQKIVIHRNSTFSSTRILEDAFPKGSTMTVWYNPDCPKESYVERYSGLDRIFRREMWIVIGGQIFIMTFLLVMFVIVNVYHW